MKRSSWEGKMILIRSLFGKQDPVRGRSRCQFPSRAVLPLSEGAGGGSPSLRPHHVLCLLQEGLSPSSPCAGAAATAAALEVPVDEVKSRPTPWLCRPPRFPPPCPGTAERGGWESRINPGEIQAAVNVWRRRK